jgi:hypothetical protein
MPRYMKELIISTEATSGASSASEVIDFELSYGYAVQAVIAGTTPAGTVKIQGSIDEITWTDITSLTVSAAGNLYDNKDAIYWPKLKVLYTQASGTGVTAKIYLATKGG